MKTFFNQEVVNGKNRKVIAILTCIALLIVVALGFGYRDDDKTKPAIEGLQVTFFACSDDADSILLQTDQTTVMIDTGLEEDSEALVTRMKQLGVSDIDLLILTHPDKDHIGGVLAVTDEFSVSQIIENDFDKSSQLQDQVEAVLTTKNTEILKETEIQKYGTGEDCLKLTIYPAEHKEIEKANESSIVVLAEYQEKSFYFTGDAMEKRNEELLNSDLPDVDVLKVPYHGRKTDNVGELIERVQPEYAIVTAGETKKKVQKALDEVGAQVFYTLDNEVEVHVTDGELTVE